MKNLQKAAYTLGMLFFFTTGPFIGIVNADWSVYQHDPQHTGFSSEETTLRSPLTQLFAVTPDGVNSSFGDMVVSGNVIYTKGASGKLYAVDAATGTTIWSTQTQTAGGHVAYANNVVYAGNGCSTSCPVEAFNATNGQLIWTSGNYPFGENGISVSGNAVYFGSDHNAFAINASTGAQIWGQHFGDAVFGSPAVANGIVYVGVYQTAPTLYALNATNGTQLWSASNLCGTGSATVVNNVVYMGDHCGDRIHAYDAAGGGQIWNTSTGDTQSDGLVYAYNNVYSEGINTGKVVAINSVNGQLVWSYTNGVPNGATTTVVAANNIIYAATGNKISLLNAQNGSLISQLATTGTVYRLAISSHTLYAATSDGKLYAFYNPPPASISVDPATSNVTVGSSFAVNVKVNGGGTPFNAAGATVTVSPSLSITGIKSPSSNSCNFDFTKSPTTANPSFAGAIYGTSSTNCIAFTMVLTPNSSGTGTITFTNGSIKAYSDNSEVLAIVNNGSYTISPILTPTGTQTLTVDDSIIGTNQNQWNYTGSGWGHCTSCNETNPSVSFYNASQSWDNVTNDYVTISFSGVQFNLYGVTDPRDGINAVSIDGGPETNIDFYSPSRTGNVLLWTSPILSNSTHTLKLRVTGTHNPSATDSYLILDRGDVLYISNLPNLAVNLYLTATYQSNLTITGTKDTAVTTVYVNGSSLNVTYPSSTTWQAQISVPTLGDNTYIIYGKDGSGNQTASINITINKHLLGDINGDGMIDLTDASLFAVDYGKTNSSTFAYPLSDMNNDGSVDLTDLSILAKAE